MRNLALLNGSVCDLVDAKVSLEDRGYLFGDGIYEIIRVYNRKPFFLAAHLQRLRRSAEAISISLPFPEKKIEKNALGLIEQSGCAQGYIYIQLSRGVAERDHLFPPDSTPEMVIYVKGLDTPLGADAVQPVKCITLPDERWLNCHIKSVNLLPNVLARQKAAEAGAVEAVFFRPGGVVTEGTRSNIFAVIDDEVRTHPESKLILSGITRRIALDILTDLGIPCLEEAFTVEEMKRASEVLSTSTTMEIKPVTVIDDEPVGDRISGPIGRSLIEAFWEKVSEYCPEE